MPLKCLCRALNSLSKFTLTLGLAALLVLVIPRLASAESYTIINLGVLTNDNVSFARAINNSGQVIGTSAYSLSTYVGSSPFIWSAAGGMQAIGTRFDGEAYGINDLGQVVGLVRYDSPYSHAFFYDGREVHELGTFGGRVSVATGINNSGQIVGTAQLPNNYTHAFLYSGGTMQDLGIFPGTPQDSGSSSAWAINNNGQVVGQADGNGPHKAFLYEGGSLLNLTVSRPSEFSVARAVNDLGQTAGTISTRAFLYGGGC